ncbi:glycoside hydrolase family 108 protein [Pelagibacterium limicola]|uniref:glycoside hydrolase family 108 protein n=1 Tax=Pelagibacterium limicola TaxID=2791022 RepID=UPI0018AFC60F|nr:glycoside hydrolase family 108 protein [Pelagibacterium limicola]
MPASRWTHCLAQILKHEGGYADHPSDPGGATNMGITHKTLARWRGIAPWWALDKSEVKALAKTEAAAIYKALYWERVKAGALPPGLDLVVFDFAVNSGPDRAVKTLQALVGVTQDGFIGPITLAAIGKRVPRTLIEALCSQRMNFLQRLATFATFGRSWTSRVADIRATALADAADAPQSDQPKGINDMNILDGYKTYAIGILMLLVGAAQLAGIAIPLFGEYSGTQLIMEALAVIFLRKGIKSEVGRA